MEVREGTTLERVLATLRKANRPMKHEEILEEVKVGKTHLYSPLERAVRDGILTRLKIDGKPALALGSISPSDFEAMVNMNGEVRLLGASVKGNMVCLTAAQAKQLKEFLNSIL